MRWRKRSGLTALGLELSFLLLLFQRVNAAELLRLYINYDLLLEAVMLAVEYIEAVLGNGMEYFGLKVTQTVIFSLTLEKNV